MVTDEAKARYVSSSEFRERRARARRAYRDAMVLLRAADRLERDWREGAEAASAGWQVVA